EFEALDAGNHIPLISIITTNVDEIIEIDKNAQYNKKLCRALIERATSVQLKIKILQRRKQEIKKRLEQNEYRESFKKFAYVVIKTRNFVANITQFQSFKLLGTIKIKEDFLQLTNLFDNCIKMLGFTVVIGDEELKDIDVCSLEEDLNEMNE
ncbi:22252_t:CDS:1, partial [Dentiscutata erythropus]